jgi:hypothetical protein
MLQHAFDPEFSKEEVFQDIPTRLIKVIGQAQADVDETELQDHAMIRGDLEMGFFHISPLCCCLFPTPISTASALPGSPLSILNFLI